MRNGREDGKKFRDDADKTKKANRSEKETKYWLTLKNMRIHRKTLLNCLMISFCRKLNCV